MRPADRHRPWRSGSAAAAGRPASGRGRCRQQSAPTRPQRPGHFRHHKTGPLSHQVRGRPRVRSRLAPPPPRFRRAPCSVPLCPGSSPAMPRICLGAPVPVPVPVPVSMPGLDDGTVPTSGHRPWSRKWPIPEPRARPTAARLMWALRVNCVRPVSVGNVSAQYRSSRPSVMYACQCVISDVSVFPGVGGLCRSETCCLMLHA